ncbi:HAD family hydrolase [Actinomycetospora rhizophila]|uniref:HAD family hydrolase n=1 Tax=Actinomycetospora rhizophila TaxID=1416876 RepID=A0ABV9ZKF3_9PSEU
MRVVEESILPRHTTISTDVFDTMLLRDHSVERDRFTMACRRVAPVLGVDPRTLAYLRRTIHALAYRAVAMERPTGDASLTSIDHTIATAVGLGPNAAEALRRAEVEVDAEHLHPNRPFLALLERAAARGTRIIAVSDTYYAEDDLHRLFDLVIGQHPIETVYASADVGLTKHSGALFAEVTRCEGLSGGDVLHVGDDPSADVQRAREAGWDAVHLPRGLHHRVVKLAGKASSLPHSIRESR